MGRMAWTGTVLGALVAAIYINVARPWQLRWGATDEEVARAMPGDEIVPRPVFNATRAVTIQARHDSGELVWENSEHEGSYGSPRLVSAGGKTQIVTPLKGHLAGFDATSGERLWLEEHKNQWGTLLNSPVIDDEGRVFVSAAQVGSLLVDPGASSDDSVW